jgi:nicotianamine synthase
MSATTALRAFPYYSNYLDLSRLEISALSTIHPKAISTVCFIGSGPLPMTSLCFLNLMSPPPTRIHNIDCDPHAIAVSSQLSKSLGTSNLTFQLADAAEVHNLSSFEVVFLAGLVGGTKDVKTRIVKNVVARCRKGTLIVLRSAHGVRKFLYQEVDVGVLPELGLKVLLVVHPWNHVVNSVVVCRVVGKEKARL